MNKTKKAMIKEFSAIEMREDLDHYIKLLESVHPNPYHKFNRTVFHEEMILAQTSLRDPMSEVDLFKVLAPIVGKLKDEHITVEFPPSVVSVALPFRVRIIEGRGFIESLQENNLRSGQDASTITEIVSIQAYNFKELVIEMQQYFFGNNDIQKQFYLEMFFGKALATRFFGNDQLEWIFKDNATGEIRTELIQQNQAVGTTLEPFEYEMENGSTARFTYREFEDPKRNFNKFLNRMFLDFRKNNVKNLIIDIRENTGGMTRYGDTLLSFLTQKPFRQLQNVKIQSSEALKNVLRKEMPMPLRALPPKYVHPRFRKLFNMKDGATLNIDFKEGIPTKRKYVFKGNLYVLIGPGTMSSASLFAGTIKTYGIGCLIGEKTGGGVSHFGCQYDYSLPNTKLIARIPSSINIGNGHGSLTPHIEIERTVAKYKEAKDTVMEYAKNLTNCITAEMAKSDIDYFVNLLQNVHPAPYVNTKQEAIQSAITAFVSQLDGNIDKAEFYRRFAPIVSMLNDEHSSVNLYYQEKARTFPYRTASIENRYIFLDSCSGNQEIPVGSELVSINGIGMQHLEKQLSQYFSGTNEAQRNFYLGENFDQALQIIFGRPDDYTIEFRITGSTETKELTVKSIYKIETEEPCFKWEKINKQIALMTFNKFEDPHKEFRTFLKEMFQTLRRDNVNHLIIDLRKNRGGATVYGDELLKYLMTQNFSQLNKSEIKISEEVKEKFLEYIPTALRWLPMQHLHPMLRKLFHGSVGSFIQVDFKRLHPYKAMKRFQGKIYVLTGPGTMSSASLLAATVKSYQAGTVIGDKTGGPATHYGNQFEFVLPYSQIEMLLPCSINYGNQLGPVEPDVFVKQNQTDIVVGKDTVIEYIKDNIGEKNEQ